MSAENSPTYTNPHARTYKIPPSRSPNSSHIHKFHQSLPSYSPSPLIPLPDVAKSLGIKAVFIKDESSRFDLPSFKILGASWGTFRAVTDHLDLPLDEARLDNLANDAQAKGIRLFAATDGNHGRAVARMAKLLGISAEIYVPGCLDEYTRDLIASEKGCNVTAIEGDYDTAVRAADQQAKLCSNGILVQDTSFENYERIPRWIVEGYSTMLDEIDSQVRNRSLAPTLLITPVGVGSLAHAVVSHCKSVEPPVSVLTVEPDTAACLHASLVAGKLTPFQTTGTIMNGLDCGTVSLTAWPDLHAGVDASTTVSDLEAHRAVEYLASQDIRLGPCGAAGLAALQRIAASDPGLLGLGADSVVVILGTEGMRPYPVPVSS
ncbi:Pyridoxal-phosphate dependent enzyme family [Coccidioides posadasii C735 delta SOWgp]|uniref:Diaminopropionate ammonia-lyase n=2 Tax=Coccidioides posadasii TaxID=199306 RepID=A0A0J6FSY7_COCPO|nr:Pyridoxal-phosphate dependent enzyme family [Coccidioides posadasii C735 delta SOWgp]EER26790.1 Pyridoxal-phosphate dependent enzyme family [Coccidioides posadasii C735 delta SOWgp]KMM72520.1 diaminopropionate ammonia-lyase [Coccidioides posadasii RMSCC 3488]|eukprot:XP_003068935.1 Pyridoxal-phosphate dependent enzyme family [Coccidioides posadasii C735 delta SOWgp]